jgi:hypothetical protein
MAQITLRVPDVLADDLRRAAAERGQSLNAWAAVVLQVAVDPELSGDEAERTRERLRRAGLLAEPGQRRGSRPDDATVARARQAAGQGRPLSDYVVEGRT